MNKNLKLLVAGVATTIAFSTVSPTLTLALNKETNTPIKISVLSDIHMFPEEFAGEQGPNFQSYLAGDRKMLMESERILDAAIKKVLDENPDVVLVPGDLTKDSEEIAHDMVANKLKTLEDNGIEVFVINGNHDINNPDAVKFVPDEENPGQDKKVIVDRVDSQEEFREVYADFGYDQAIAKHNGSVSYVAQLKPGYRLISIDTGTYGDDPSDQKTEGYFRDGLVDWVLQQIEDAKKAGDEIIGMMHHGIVEHFDGQATIFAPYVVKDWERVSTLFADAGMKYVFTGHFHAQDIVSKTTDAGNTIYDIMTGSLVTAPSPLRTVEILPALDRIKVESEKIESIEGIADFQKYASDFLAAGIPDMVVGLVQDILLGMFPEETYELNEALEMVGFTGADINVEEELAKAIENGTFEQARSLAIEEGVEDVDSINAEIYLDGKALITNKQIRNFIIAVTDEFKTATLPGTVGPDGNEVKFMDVVQECLVQVYNGDETITPQMQQIMDQMAEGEMIPSFFTKAIVKHKNKLGLVGAIINENMINGLFNTVISEGTTVGDVLTNALHGLMVGLLNDKNPGDNNILLYANKILTAVNVIEAINTIPGIVTLTNKERVQAVRFVYNDLSDTEKKLVSNYNLLTAAEETIAKLESDSIADQKAADEVIALIESISSDVTLADKELIKKVRAAYNSLTDTQKTLIDASLLTKLEASEEIITNLEVENANKADKEIADKVIKLIESIPSDISLDDKALIEQVRAEYEKLTDTQKALVGNLLTRLESAEFAISELEKAQDNNTDDDTNNGSNNNNNNNGNNSNNNSGNTGNNNSSSNTNNNNSSTNPSTGDSNALVSIALVGATLSGLALAFRKKISKALKINK